MGVALQRRAFDASALLDEPTPTQIRVLEYIAEAYVFNGWKWAVWDFIQGQL